VVVVQRGRQDGGQQQAAVGVHQHVPLAAEDPFSRASCPRMPATLTPVPAGGSHKTPPASATAVVACRNGAASDYSASVRHVA
jgi:hypothetical protein